MNENKIKYECRNAVFFKAVDGSDNDMILVNEKVHHPDGTITSNLRQIHDFKKPVWIHKPAFRKYTQKQVYKPAHEMDVIYTTESKLLERLKKAFDIPIGKYMSQKQIQRSPYIYGADISTSSIIRKEYKKRFPDANSNATVAVLDIETSVVTAREEIIAISLSFKDKAIVATTKDFIGSMPLAEEKFFQKLDELTPEVRRDRHCEVEFHIAETSALACIEVFKRAHEWKPDFIIGWNLMAFDIPRIIDNLKYEGYDPANVFSDPSIPPKFRQCHYRQGATSHKTTSNKVMPLAGYEQWHSLECPASFYFIDAMCLFYQIRRGGPQEENYKLDTILTKYTGRGKVDIKEAEHLDGLDKHRFMQENYKIEYLVYNLYDCVGLEILDEKEADVSEKLNILVGVSDLCNYTSNPRRLADSLHFFVQEDSRFNGVLGTVSDEMKSDLDECVPTLDGWIVALPTERLIHNGLKMVKEMPDYVTKAHGQSSDVDVSSGYPNIEIAMNMSKDTTFHELDRIEGLSNYEQRVVGLNLVGGVVNSMSFATTVYRLPQAKDAYQIYQQQRLQ